MLWGKKPQWPWMPPRAARRSGRGRPWRPSNSNRVAAPRGTASSSEFSPDSASDEERAAIDNDDGAEWWGDAEDPAASDDEEEDESGEEEDGWEGE